MKFFIDTANIDEIKEANAMGMVDGVTTNPSLLMKEGRQDTDALLKEICDAFGISPEIRVDPGRFRPTDRSPRLDTSLLREHTGWTAQYARRQTLEDMIGGAS